MEHRGTDDREVAEKESQTAARGAARQKDYFVQLMFFQASEEPDDLDSRRYAYRPPENYVPLQHSKTEPGERYYLPLPSSAAPVRLDSPATAVMTDLRRASAVTVDRDTPVVEANQLMIERGVRALFVTDAARRMLGIITSMDILGERPIQFAQAQGLRHSEVLVRDIMTPEQSLEVLDFRDVQRARVGDVVATLKLAGRQHALAAQAAEGGAAGEHVVCGIFSLTQIARQLGIAPQPVHDIARTFAEIEAVIAGDGAGVTR